MLSLLIFVLVSDTAPIHTTVADSSHVSFIAQIQLTWETVEHESLHYIKFTDISTTDSIGFPELPMITCLIAVPDSVTPALEFAMSSIMEETVNPVFPALDISDRVRYPGKCDLEIHEADIEISKFPRETATGIDIPITFTVQNNGNHESDEYDVRITIIHGTSVVTGYINNCDEIPARDEAVREYVLLSTELSGDYNLLVYDSV